MDGRETAKIVLGGGCFWCLEAVLMGRSEIVAVEPGYAGGHTRNPSYNEVSTGKTGHAEVVQVEYKNENEGLEKLLEIFFLAHDPTTLNRQGHDVGEQYRSIILYENEEQRRIAKDIIKEMDRAGKLPGPIVTELKKLEKFYLAEGEHRNYWSRNPEQSYCQLVIAPKVAEVNQRLSEKNTSDRFE